MICFSEKVVVHSETTVLMDEQCMWPPIPLLAISPAHGRVQYVWKKEVKKQMNGRKVMFQPTLVYSMWILQNNIGAHLMELA